MKLFAAIPTHSGALAVETTQTLLVAQHLVLQTGGSIECNFQSGSEIGVVRNRIVAAFLGSDASHLLMVDSDQGIEADALERMLQFDKPVVGCVYPMRKFQWNNVHLGMAASIEQVLLGATPFIGALVTDENGQAQVSRGFALAEWVGTGVIIIKREVFETLMMRHPELEGIGFEDDAGDDPTSNNWGFFNPYIREDGYPISEDLSFCRRWREVGGEIWAEVCGESRHVGRHVFRGSYLEHLRSSRGS